VAPLLPALLPAKGLDADSVKYALGRWAIRRWEARCRRRWWGSTGAEKQLPRSTGMAAC